MENIKRFHKQTKYLLEEVQKRSDDLFQVFRETRDLSSSRSEDFSKNFGEVWDGENRILYEPTHRMIEDALGIVYHKAIKKSARDPKALRSLRDFF